MSKQNELDEQKRLNRIMFEALKEIARNDGIQAATLSAQMYVKMAKTAIAAVTKKS
jgi:predicted DNA-binding ribbon-helix-helix protein